MTHKNYCLLDENGIELNVGCDIDASREINEDAISYFELTSCEIVIKGVGIDILPYLTDKQGNHIATLAMDAYYSEKADKETERKYRKAVDDFERMTPSELETLTRKIFNI